MGTLFPDLDEQALALAERVDPRYAPVWQGRPAAERAALARYYLPHGSAKSTLSPSRPRVVKWYCPFADQRQFPSGHRYCINVYTGCAHGCVYCYAAGYLAMDARPKTDFRRMLLRDLADLEAFDVPAAPVHLSNSTDCLQPLEAERGDTLFTLRQLVEHRRRFTTLTLLTKNPSLAARPEYLQALGALDEGPGRRVVVEVSLAFWREDVARAYDPGAPSVADRVAAIRALRRAGLAVVLRVSPTYPIDQAPPGQTAPQTRADLQALARLAGEEGIGRIVHTPAKIVRPRHGGLHPRMAAMLQLYRRLAGSQGLEFRGGAWRLPHAVAQHAIVGPVQDVCRSHGIQAVFCRSHLLETR